MVVSVCVFGECCVCGVVCSGGCRGGVSGLWCVMLVYSGGECCACEVVRW